ncbi:hypothetical protein FA13DRAFT_1729933 [Coprinellus micaceus]|uniref:Uncharacterized protein n=1 Tax=Coprinellus micaceus TaxID=71717 RepID=A0A4Y7TIA6_COPMI|nr:hypothetical protein FA13DRAFT_1729933 [Coprinellus micaceus]
MYTFDFRYLNTTGLLGLPFANVIDVDFSGSMSSRNTDGMVASRCHLERYRSQVVLGVNSSGTLGRGRR